MQGSVWVMDVGCEPNLLGFCNAANVGFVSQEWFSVCILKVGSMAIV